MASSTSLDLTRTYLDLQADGKVAEIPVSETFWQDLMSGGVRIEGRMVMAAEMTADMRHWEMHPAGDEVLVLMNGRAIVVLEEPDGPRQIEVSAGEVVIVPRGCWHRIKVVEPGKMVFMTAGDGTENKPFEDAV
ncbi:cupin domain-containing protein [Pelagibius sp.]|uniref:cupin domain-containing protein n=1 Tax=Pelagibius sp. TaxID=1931238 RepID=UPI0026061A6A|nr:cupin domain-containing protein [Pelagibius sp.]